MSQGTVTATARTSDLTNTVRFTECGAPIVKNPFALTFRTQRAPFICIKANAFLLSWNLNPDNQMF
jgi:hypothetical protein